ncbi:transposase [Pseudomonas mediterranea]
MSGLAWTAAWVKKGCLLTREIQKVLPGQREKGLSRVTIRHSQAQKAAHYNQRSVLRGGMVCRSDTRMGGDGGKIC